MSDSPGLIEKIRQKDVTVAVIGLGYVGLPLAVAYAEAGVRVVGLDVDAPRVAAINRGVSHIPDVPSARLAPLVQSGRFRATTDYATCAAADAAVICVPTPFTKMKAPDLSSIEAACRALFALLVPPEKIHRVSSPRVAEMCKLLENIFRSVNIALVNELAKLCDRMGIDIWEVIDAAATKPFGFMPFYPGPGRPPARPESSPLRARRPA